MDNRMTTTAQPAAATTQVTTAQPATATTQATPAKPLKIAVPKGSLYAQSVELLARAGLDTGNLQDPGRQLTVCGQDVEYYIVRPTDVPVFASYGGVDCAICGKDSLEEAALDVVELVDLKFGACRFVVAEPEQPVSAADANYQRLGVLRVATKYPRITTRYYDSIGTQIEIVKMHGNIELAPLSGLAERIVDITATGTTLKENNLRIVSEVMFSTARFVGNAASVRTDPRVRALAGRLQELCAKSK